MTSHKKFTCTALEKALSVRIAYPIVMPEYQDENDVAQSWAVFCLE